MNKTFYEFVDPKISPKEDFFAHANGLWIKNNSIPEDQSRWGSFSILREENLNRLKAILEDNATHSQLRNFYQAGTNAKEMQPEAVAQLKLWLSELWSVNHISDLVTFLGKLHKNALFAGFLFYVDFDDQDSTKYVLRFEQGGLGLPDRDYYLEEDEKMAEVRKEYLKHLASISDYFNSLGLASFNVHIVYDTEKALASASMSSTEHREIEKQYNVFSPQEFNKRFVNINLENYQTGLALPLPQRFLVNQINFFGALNNLFLQDNLEQLKHYFTWQLLRKVSSFLGEELEQKQFNFYGRVLSGALEMLPRWKRIIYQVDNSLGESLGQEYLIKFFPSEAKERMQLLVEDLRMAFKARIEKLSWMSEDTKQKALKKLEAFEVKIGGPETPIDYSFVKVLPDNFLGNVCEANQFEVERNFSKLNKPVDRKEWFMTSPTVNAYHYPNLVEIVFPAGILQFPFFDFELDDAVNYGAIGAVIGHELTHGFDDKGSQFDERGNFVSWWKEEDRKAFDALTQKLVDRADKFEVLPGVFLKGKLTLGENIADLGGLAVAYDALKRAIGRTGNVEMIEGLTQDQRFFLSYARTWCGSSRPEKEREFAITDPHAHIKFRTNEIVKNMNEFYDAFGIKEGDKMYISGEDRIKIW